MLEGEEEIPAILKPNFDLLGFYVGKNWALPNKLLASKRTWLGALSIDSLKSLHLLCSVSNVLPRTIKMPGYTPTTALSMMSYSHGHFVQNPQHKFQYSQAKKGENPKKETKRA